MLPFQLQLDTVTSPKRKYDAGLSVAAVVLECQMVP